MINSGTATPEPLGYAHREHATEKDESRCNYIFHLAISPCPREFILISDSPSVCLINPGHFGTISDRTTYNPYNISVVMDPLNSKIYTIRIESHAHDGFKCILIKTHADY
ncbi:unnamed protein product [Lepeophtheirus salmonis]|uniref:(salmon louse) hypothetical protein n=1 Tax=Lepeophtheirus salmonis TaxID=72036 RepID=A0A7R8H1Y2_LEPSM|nr:unnamed protein product [Lepeophtheirus salmonis]CAF2803332.1 unnamed protein product [Lepeophtheirus salmonis]